MRRFLRAIVLAAMAVLAPRLALADDIPLELFGSQTAAGYSVFRDAKTPYDGRPALAIAANGPAGDAFGSSVADLDATPFRGKRIRFTAMVKTAGVETNASLWLRVDGLTKMAFDNMMPGRGLTGDRGWTPLAVVLDVAPDATRIVFGGLLVAQHGTMWIAAPKLEIVPNAVPVTGGTRPVENAPKNEAPRPPHVLAREQRAAALRTLRSAAVPLATVDPAAPDGDLAAFDRAVGGARLVGLGEGTHGTSEFFAMKDRLFRELVEKKGFTVFAIEANQPEARQMEAYVTTGAGDPAAALRAMYFWTWQTREVLALVQWMRAYNVAPGKHPTLHFAGFDMQTPDVAEAAVERFAKAHDAAAGAAIAREYACLPKSLESVTLSTEAKRACGASVRAVVPMLAKLSPDIDTAHDARIVEQYADAALSADVTQTGSALRDRSMAENVGWLAETAYPHAKIAVWAHNYHISDAGDDERRSMGSWLHRRFGASYYRLGFAFDRGTVRAAKLGAGVTTHTVVPALPGSLEALLRDAGARYFVDLDALPNGPLRTWLDGGTLTREIGAVYDSRSPNAYYHIANVRQMFDGLIFISEMHAAQGISSAS